MCIIGISHKNIICDRSFENHMNTHMWIIWNNNKYESHMQISLYEDHMHCTNVIKWELYEISMTDVDYIIKFFSAKFFLIYILLIQSILNKYIYVNKHYNVLYDLKLKYTMAQLI